MIRHYICAVLPAGGGLPQRAKMYDLGGYQSFVTDIKVNERTGQAMRRWCVVAVEADEAAHDLLAGDPEVWATDSAPARASARNFMMSRGEPSPPTSIHDCLHLSNPGAKVSDLTCGTSRNVRKAP